MGTLVERTSRFVRLFALPDGRTAEKVNAGLADMSTTPLNGAVVDSITTPSGNGYFMVGTDGGIFCFGDAMFRGSSGGQPLNAPVLSLVPDTSNLGYWLVAAAAGSSPTATPRLWVRWAPSTSTAQSPAWSEPAAAT